MIAVIIAGGSGTRLWPISTPEYPKHLLKINGDNNSLLQNTYARAKQIADKIYVISEKGHIKHVREQLSDLPAQNFIVEPARRGTSSCIIASLVEIDHKLEDEPIAFLSADHYIRDIPGFVHSFQVAGQTSKKYGSIVLVGVEPDYPATGFGYIQKGKVVDDNTFAYTVQCFKEKPDYDTAKQYLKSGNYLWNCGYFVGSVATFKKAMKANAPDLYKNYERLKAATKLDYEKVYLNFENVSIDYALIEKVPDLLVVPANFDWLDLGSFADMHKAVDRDQKGNHLQGNIEVEDIQNSFVQNHEDKPLAVIGLDNIVVVNSPSGILVARKDLSQKVGEISKKFNS